MEVDPTAVANSDEGSVPSVTSAPVSKKKEKASLTNISTNIADYELPKASIQRVLKSTLPGRPFHKEVKTAMTRCSTIFLPYLTDACREVASERGLKTITPAIVEEALKRIGFGDWNEIIGERISKESEERERKRNKKTSAFGTSSSSSNVPSGLIREVISDANKDIDFDEDIEIDDTQMPMEEEDEEMENEQPGTSTMDVDSEEETVNHESESEQEEAFFKSEPHTDDDE
jgi:histone H3/H4